jgi:hypothetical protein
MMTIKEIEAACVASQPLDFSHHHQEVLDLPLKQMFYPLGFPVEVSTNAPEVLDLYQELWGMFGKQHDTPPIRAHVHVTEGGSIECPPTPVYRILLPQMLGIADANNYSIADFEHNTVRITIARETLRHKPYLKYCLLGAPGSCISTRYTTPIHAGCVSLDGRGVLLCGDSGAGKSTLSYACARAGWTFTSDDGVYVSNDRKDLQVTGEYHKVRFRPPSAVFFPEISGLEISRRAGGKESIEFPTATMPNIVCAQTAEVAFIVFLDRNSKGPPALTPYRKDVARYAMMQILYGLPETRGVQLETIERLLSLDVFELRYSNLDWAIERLQKLVREGR